MRSSDRSDRVSGSVKGLQNQWKCCATHSGSGVWSQSAVTIRRKGSNTAILGTLWELVEIIIIWMRHLTIHLEMTKKKSATTISTWMISRSFAIMSPWSRLRLIAMIMIIFYYKEKKLSFTKQEDVYKRSLQAAKKGKVLVFHWRGDTWQKKY